MNICVGLIVGKTNRLLLYVNLNRYISFQENKIDITILNLNKIINKTAETVNFCFLLFSNDENI